MTEEQRAVWHEQDLQRLRGFRLMDDDFLSAFFRDKINDFYCRDLSVKIRSHLAVKRKNGEFIGAFACF